MKKRHHIYFFCLATTLWTFFFLAGLWSNYYQQWNWYWQLIFILVIPVVILAQRAPHLIRQAMDTTPMRAAWPLAFYFSVPFLLYDFIYLHLSQGLPLSYLWDYWYLTLFSVVPWGLFPITALGLKKEKVGTF